MTTHSAFGSGILAICAAMISQGCTPRSEAAPEPTRELTRAPVSAHPAAPEVCLGLSDKGIFADLDPKVQLALPAKLAADRVTARIDDAHHVLVLSIDGFPRKAYPLDGTAILKGGAHELALRAGDRDELRPLLADARLTTGASAHDRDNDGIPDPLDILIGAKKTVLNADAYTPEAEAYISRKYPCGRAAERCARGPRGDRHGRARTTFRRREADLSRVRRSGRLRARVDRRLSPARLSLGPVAPGPAAGPHRSEVDPAVRRLVGE